MSTPRRRASRGVYGPGWHDLASNPVPGDVLKCLADLGIEVERISGEEAVAKCPGHLERKGREERHASWAVNLDSGLHNCFSCGFQGSFVHLVAYLNGEGRAEAASWVRSRGAIDYVKRKLATKEEAIARRPFGEAELALYIPPPPSALASRLLDPDACADLGILWDTTQEMWITPIRDPVTNKLIGYQEKNSRYFRNRPRDIQKSHCLFGLNAFRGPVAILVESPLDVARLRSVGLACGLGSYGSEVSQTQINLLVEHADEVCFALDNDSSGRKSTRTLLDATVGRIKRSLLNYSGTEAKDPGEMGADEINNAFRTRLSAFQARRELRC